MQDMVNIAVALDEDNLHSHTETGDGGVLTNPRITGSICDTAGNELIKFSKTGSPTDYLVLGEELITPGVGDPYYAHLITTDGPSGSSSLCICCKGTSTFKLESDGGIQIGSSPTDTIKLFDNSLAGATQAAKQADFVPVTVVPVLGGDTITAAQFTTFQDEVKVALDAILLALETIGLVQPS